MRGISLFEASRTVNFSRFGPSIKLVIFEPRVYFHEECDYNENKPT